MDPFEDWTLSASRQDDGSVYLQLTWKDGGVGLTLTDEERAQLAEVFNIVEARGFHRVVRKDK